MNPSLTGPDDDRTSMHQSPTQVTVKMLDVSVLDALTTCARLSRFTSGDHRGMLYFCYATSSGNWFES